MVREDVRSLRTHGASAPVECQYNNIASNGTTHFVTWGDNRTVVTTSAGTTENEPDVFLQTY